MAAWADSAVFWQQGCSKFNVIFACGIKRHQCMMGKSFGKLANPARK
jgi:hypothetical protein